MWLMILFTLKYYIKQERLFFYENQFNSDILKWSLYVFYSYKIYQAVVDVIEFNIKIVREDQAYKYYSIEARVTITTRKWVE